MRPKKRSAELGEQYGVSAKVIATITVTRFEAMSEDARLVMLSQSAREKAKQHDGVDEGAPARRLERQREIRKASRGVGVPFRERWRAA